MKTVSERVYAYRIETDSGVGDQCIVADPCDHVCLCVDGRIFNGDARHLRGWAEQRGFAYFDGCDTAEVRVS